MLLFHLMQRMRLSSKACRVLYVTLLQGNPRTKYMYASFNIVNPHTQRSFDEGAQKYKIWAQF